MEAAIHVGQNYLANLEVYKNTNFEELQNLVHITEKLILHHQVGILNVKRIEWTTSSWTRSRLSHDQTITWTKARVHVYSDSVLCLGKMSDHSEANRRWENQIQEFRQSNSHRELLGIDGEPIEFVWNISQDLRHCRFLRKSTMICENETLNLQNAQTGSSSCQRSGKQLERGIGSGKAEAFEFESLEHEDSFA